MSDEIPEVIPEMTEADWLQGALDSANKRTARVKRQAVDLLLKGAKANRDLAAGLEAAAKTIEEL